MKSLHMFLLTSRSAFSRFCGRNGSHETHQNRFPGLNYDADSAKALDAQNLFCLSQNRFGKDSAPQLASATTAGLGRTSVDTETRCVDGVAPVKHGVSSELSPESVLQIKAVGQ